MNALLSKETDPQGPRSIWTIYPTLEREKLREKNHELIRQLRNYGDENILIHLIEDINVISLTDYEEATNHDWPTDRQNIILGRGLK